jgi:uncharacterized protein (TIGR00269 family)
MFEFNSRIAVGVSGGKDSLNLLHALIEIEDRFPKVELIAISIDEGVKGYRDEALRLTEEACARLGVECLILSFRELFGFTLDEIIDKTVNVKLTPCSHCGILRRRALNEAAKKVDADRLATAHNLDDMAQTVLLNLMRGDLRRLLTLHPRGNDLKGFVRRVKPFSKVPERESTLYSYLKGIEFQCISCPYSDKTMRTDIRRFLNRMEAKHPGIKFVIYRKGLTITHQTNTAEPSSQCSICGEPTRRNKCRVCQILGELS